MSHTYDLNADDDVKSVIRYCDMQCKRWLLHWCLRSWSYAMFFLEIGTGTQHLKCICYKIFIRILYTVISREKNIGRRSYQWIWILHFFILDPFSNIYDVEHRCTFIQVIWWPVMSSSFQSAAFAYGLCAIWSDDDDC